MMEYEGPMEKGMTMPRAPRVSGLEELKQAIERLDHMVNSLGTRLEPILGMRVEQPEATVHVPDAPARTELRLYAARIHEIASHAAQLEERLEL